MEKLPLAKIKNWFEQNREDILRDYFTLLRFPSISTDTAFASDIRKTAEWLSDYLRKAGLDIELWETPGYPVIYGSSMHAGPDRPTVLIYGHYDVQPVDPLDLWKNPPFEPIVKNGQVYARGASDNKGQCFYSIQAIRAFLELHGQKKLNIKIFIEGEEECGGKGTSSILESKKSKLKADYLFVVDCSLPGPDQPATIIGMRGITTMEVEIRNSHIDLHSGSHGGIALNPNRALVQLLAKLWDENGTVTVPGFYDDLNSLSPEELKKIDHTFDKEQYTKMFGVKAFSNEKGTTLTESNWLRPTLEINGIWGGYTGSGFKTVIPSIASAKISCRLVPDQDPQKINQLVSDFLKTHLPHGMEIKMHFHHGARAYRMPLDAKIIQAAARAYEEVFQKPCSTILEGASVPIVGELVDVTGAEAALLGVALTDDDIHAPNEHFGLDRFEKGFLVIERLLEQLCLTN